MAGKKEFSAGVVKALKSFFQLFSVPDSECGQSVESWSWRSNNMVRGLISERSYPWAVEPAGLNGSIQHQLSGGSGGELERCLRWGSSWSDRRRHRCNEETAAKPSPATEAQRDRVRAWES